MRWQSSVPARGRHPGSLRTAHGEDGLNVDDFHLLHFVISAFPSQVETRCVKRNKPKRKWL